MSSTSTSRLGLTASALILLASPALAVTTAVTTQCSPGTTAAPDGLSCVPCPAGTFAGAGDDTCNPCPPGTVSLLAGSTGIDNCTPCST
ncbi:hypothetical protein PG997_011833 [Apiospora hydei]|uniref:Tyrosine-protein kinase ephrin type A/B receptor-like domain-containing protein n=1 Tax=Apiospora hydei TaxID=1337664 RepID=A0ABR1V1M1_9PEZI